VAEVLQTRPCKTEAVVLTKDTKAGKAMSTSDAETTVASANAPIRASNLISKVQGTIVPVALTNRPKIGARHCRRIISVVTREMSIGRNGPSVSTMSVAKQVNPIVMSSGVVEVVEAVEGSSRADVLVKADAVSAAVEVVGISFKAGVVAQAVAASVVVQAVAAADLAV
jgi:hypothetical protein